MTAERGPPLPDALATGRGLSESASGAVTMETPRQNRYQIRQVRAVLPFAAWFSRQEKASHEKNARRDGPHFCSLQWEILQNQHQPGKPCCAAHSSLCLLFLFTYKLNTCQ